MHFSKRMAANLPAAFMAPTVPPSSYPATVKLLILKVEFKQESPDEDTTTGDGTWGWCASACNGDPDYWVNKNAADLKKYYEEVSYGKLNLIVDVYPQAAGTAYTLTNSMAYYGAENEPTLKSFISESISKADVDVQFSQYDAVLIVHAGAGEETDIASDTANDLWSMYYSFSPGISVDGTTISEAIIMPQTGTQDGGTVDPLGIYAHEFGHWLGLPDLYDTGARFPNTVEWDGVGKWSLMGDGIYLSGPNGQPRGSSPAHPDAWCKSYLGWVTPQTVSADNTAISLTPVETNQDIIKLPASTTTATQYFLIENRQRGSGTYAYDYGLPASGLLVWLIDEDVINAWMANNTVNDISTRPGVALIEADGNNALKTYGGDYGSSGDPFPGSYSKTSFTPYTNPASTPYTGSAWLYIKNIAVAGFNITATAGFAPTPPTNLSYAANSATTLTWTASADSATYAVYKNNTKIGETTQTLYTVAYSVSGDNFAVSGIDSNGYESAKSGSVTISMSSGDDGGKTGCFIATAAYGSYEAPYVKILREFRDSYLLPNAPGTAFVRFYYRVSPPIADFISENEFLKGMVRFLLLPMIGFAAFLLKTTLVEKILMIFGVAVVWVYKRERNAPQPPLW